MNWLSDLLAALGRFIPRLILIPATHRGVRFGPRGGVKAVGPGAYFFWPITHAVKTFPVVRTTINLSNQAIMTEDDVTVFCSAVVVFRVTDIVKALAETAHLVTAVSDIALCAVVETISKWKFKEEVADYQNMERRLKRICGQRLRPFGISVERVALSDCAPCRVIRLVGDTDPTSSVSIERDEMKTARDAA